MAELINARGSYINAKVKIIFADGNTIELSGDSDNNYLTSIELDEQLSSDTECPVGVISSRVLDLELNSINKLLIPDNELSPYYGNMNDTAKVELYITEDNETRFFGRYFVNEWNSDISSSSPNRVVISATDILGTICKMEVPPVDVGSNTKINDYLIAVFNTINEKLDEADRIIIDEKNIDFTSFPNMVYCNLNMNSMGDMLNHISQSTLTNISVDRNNVLRTDFCCDDTKREAKYYIQTVTSAKLLGMYSNYDGVKCIYDRVSPEEIISVASIYGEELFIGEENNIDGLKFDEAIYKVNRVCVEPEDTECIVYVSDMAYTRNSINLTIKTDKNTKANIIVYGQPMSNSEILFEVGGKHKLEMHCSVIEENYVQKYAELLLNLMQIKNNGLSVVTYLKSDIKLGDIVYCDCSGAMNIKGYYKIIGIDWDISAYGKATVKMIKTFNIDYNLNSLLLSQITMVFKRLLGIDVNKMLMNDITVPENTCTESKIGELLDKLR